MTEPIPADDAPHVLVVDDDQRLRGLLRRFLADAGFRVTDAGTAAEARTRLASMEFDVMVLDVMMPGENGFDLLTGLRQGGRATPVLMLTAMAEPADRIRGLEIGAEDYLAKPFEPRELVLRLRAIMRRGTPAGTAASTGESLVRFGPFVFDLDRSALTESGEPVKLTTAETTLLSALAGKAGTTLSRDDLAQLGGIEGNVRTVDVQVTRLRRKIEADPKFPRWLQTVWGRGYVLKPD
jgi:two-component system phosphate regulon response regulator OmpR